MEYEWKIEYMRSDGLITHLDGCGSIDEFEIDYGNIIGIIKSIQLKVKG